MKNLFLSLATIAIFTLSSFTSVNAVEVSTSKPSNTVSCRWRTTVVVNGVPHHSEWTNGNCNVTDSGRLLPIK